MSEPAILIRRLPRRAIALIAIALLVAALVPAVSNRAQAQTAEDCAEANETYRELLDCVSLEDVRAHQEAWQKIALENGNTRASGTPGYDASADYVVELLEEAGYEVTRQEFEFPYFEVATDAVLEQLTPVPATYETGTYEYSGSGDVTGGIVPVDLALTGDRASTSGCEPEDFDGPDLSGDADIALIQRGACTFGLKAQNAQDAGAEAVIIFNQGNTEDRTGVIVGTLGGDAAGVVTIPVVGASFAAGEALAVEGATARVATETLSEVRSTENVIADSVGGNPDNIVMAGAHLDSVAEGPGINDNGSGSAAILETALEMAEVSPVNKLRFAWWGAEESGLIGSTYYVANLTESELDAIALYQNYDMIGSPNYIFGVYDADESTFPAPQGVPIPDGSVAVENVYEAYYTLFGHPYTDSEFSGRSDYQAFIQNGIPSGGLFTGAEVLKTEEQEEIWGGIAGMQYDPCYHEECDTYFNNSDEALDVNSDAVAFAMLTFAYSTELVNGVPGRRVPGFPSIQPSGAADTRGVQQNELSVAPS